MQSCGLLFGNCRDAYLISLEKVLFDRYLEISLLFDCFEMLSLLLRKCTYFDLFAKSKR